MKRDIFRIKARNFNIELGKKTLIMGIVNTTPDSFSQDGCLKLNKNGINKAVRLAKKVIKQGADILDIGGESSRPNAKKITIQEEIDRVIPVIEKLKTTIDIPISIDSYKPKVIKEALKAGASIINNIKGTQLDNRILKDVKKYNAAIILMHMQGSPQTMQKNIEYKNVISDIKAELKKSIQQCLKEGIIKNQILIDPGIGFGKTIEHNLLIINCLQEFSTLKYPILMGTSRKSVIGKILSNNVNERLMGTAATVTASILNGAHIVRVHDVKEIFDVTRMTDAIINKQ